MTEKLLQFIWQFQYFNTKNLLTTEGEEVSILFQGQFNKNQGPDFLNAKIRIGHTVLVGSVEMHLKTSDWIRHNHDIDGNYKNVILHVVYSNDVHLSSLPTLELNERISTITLERYEYLMNNNKFIACENKLLSINNLIWISWKERLLAERLTRKTQKIFDYLKRNKFNWEASFWWLLARNFGGKVNAEAFESLANSINISILAKHKNSIHQLEALLLGQAGCLNTTFQDNYAQMLSKEYKFLKEKYNLTSILIPIHSLRMRPGNFPTVRLAQLAMLIHSSTHLFAKVLETHKIEDVKTWLSVTANDYWHYRYVFDQPSDFRLKRLGSEMINNIIINSIVPIIFSYGCYHNNESLKLKALTWLEQVDAEKNSLMDEFYKLNIKTASAFDSQALLELKSQYCDHKRCLECAIGNSLLRSS